jgi:hypothetical protein
MVDPYLRWRSGQCYSQSMRDYREKDTYPTLPVNGANKVGMATGEGPTVLQTVDIDMENVDRSSRW